jgi:hypothetical protein
VLTTLGYALQAFCHGLPRPIVSHTGDSQDNWPPVALFKSVMAIQLTVNCFTTAAVKQQAALLAFRSRSYDRLTVP